MIDADGAVRWHDFDLWLFCRTSQLSASRWVGGLVLSWTLRPSQLTSITINAVLFARTPSWADSSLSPFPTTMQNVLWSIWHMRTWRYLIFSRLACWSNAYACRAMFLPLLPTWPRMSSRCAFPTLFSLRSASRTYLHTCESWYFAIGPSRMSWSLGMIRMPAAVAQPTLMKTLEPSSMPAPLPAAASAPQPSASMSKSSEDAERQGRADKLAQEVEGLISGSNAASHGQLLMDPCMFNTTKVCLLSCSASNSMNWHWVQIREAFIPSANGHMSARAMAKVMATIVWLLMLTLMTICILIIHLRSRATAESWSAHVASCHKTLLLIWPQFDSMLMVMFSNSTTSFQGTRCRGAHDAEWCPVGAWPSEIHVCWRIIMIISTIHVCDAV